MYAVVERSGMEKEFVWSRRFKTIATAERFVKSRYSPEEREVWPVLIALVRKDGTLTYEY
ncbi:MAG: hypothetical protein EHM35_13625 [Planctomycetaceae bacterium]|nr:MAG: hypothetical protein EHM35_13625 [Planctomycetaceae bacterium]